MKNILKFDTGRDGFERMVWIMIFIALVILGAGIYFLLTTFKS